MGVLELIGGAEIEYAFTLLQLILLMELADAESVFTYPLPEDGEFTDEDYILAMHDLISRGFVEITEEAAEKKTEGASGPVYSLSQKAVGLVGSIFHAGRVLEAVSAWEGMLPSLIYRGASSCAVTQWDLEDGYVYVSSMDAAGLGTWLEEAGFLPSHPFETEREGEKALRYDAQTRESLDRIRSSIVCTPDVPAPLWALQEDVRCVLRTAQRTGDANGKLAVFFETDTESWILLGDTGAGEAGSGTGSGGDGFGMGSGEDSFGTGSGEDSFGTGSGGAGFGTGFGENASGTGNEDWEIVPDSRERRDRLWSDLV